MSFLAKSIIFAAGRAGLTRDLHTSAASLSGMRKWVFDSAGYNKYGLLADDILNDMDEDVKEAIRRLPDDIVDERNYRMLRAVQLNITKSILPKDQWTKFEDDKHYLIPYLEEVIKERKEREAWEATH